MLNQIRAEISTVNPMIISLKEHISQVDENPNVPKYNIVLGEKAPPGADPQLYLLPTKRELSAVIIDFDSNIDFTKARKRREIVLQSHGGILQTLQSNNALYDPLSYAILFPYGDLGWTHDIIQNDKKVSEMKFYCYRLHFRDIQNSINLDSILHSGLLSHQYIIDAWIKTEESRLLWLYSNQSKLRAELYQGKVNFNTYFFLLLPLYLLYF